MKESYLLKDKNVQLTTSNGQYCCGLLSEFLITYNYNHKKPIKTQTLNISQLPNLAMLINC